jgi:hypothetical protein
VLALALALAGCVPAAEETAPKGGVGITTVPTAGSRGEPFTTSDGWTVHVESLAVQLYLVAVPDDGVEGGFGGTYVFPASAPQEFIIRAIPQGRVTTTLSLSTRNLGNGADLGQTGDMNRVAPDVDSRFSQPADDDGVTLGTDPATGDFTLTHPDGPAVVFRARGEKAGRIVVLDVGLAGSPSGTQLAMEVQANALSSSSIVVAAEKLFTRNGVLVFDDLASADADGDGALSKAELQHFEVLPCDRCTDDEKAARTTQAQSKAMGAVLGVRAADLLVTP